MTKNEWEKIVKFLKYYRFVKVKLISIIICSVILLLIKVIEPFIWARLIDLIIDFNSTIFKYLFIYIIFRIALVFFEYIYKVNILKVNKKIHTIIKIDLLHSILSQDLDYYKDMKVGEFVSRFHSDVVAVTKFITDNFVTIFISIIKIAIVGVYIARLNIILTIILILFSIVFFYIYKKSGVLLHEQNTKVREIADRYFTSLYQTIYGIQEIKVLGVEIWSINKNKKIFEEIENEDTKLDVLDIKMQYVPKLLEVIIALVLITISIFMISNNQLNLQNFLIFIAYGHIFSDSIKEILKLNALIPRTIVSFDRLDQILNIKKEEYVELQNNVEFDGSIVFRNVEFGYERDKIIDRISFAIKPNSFNMIIGKSGCGKTTILSLIAGLYKVDSGEIYIGEQNVSSLSRKHITKNISYVLQSPFLFNESIIDNFKLVNSKKSFEHVVNACKKAYIHDFIISLPDGYNTIINEQSINLSGGEKLRLALARVIYKDTKIILLDEATASLDTVSNSYVMKSLSKLSKEKTIVMITHKLDDLIYADNIIVIEEHGVECEGKYLKIKEESSVYLELLSKQQHEK